MKNGFYVIWVDAIRSIRKNHPKDKNWKPKVFAILTWINAINYWMIIAWIDFFEVLQVPKFQFDLLNIKFLNGALSFLIIFASPFLVLNYFLIFYKDRYKWLLDKYPYQKYRWSAIYSFTILITALISGFLIGVVLKA
jgi:hypothetical protein